MKKIICSVIAVVVVLSNGAMFVSAGDPFRQAEEQQFDAFLEDSFQELLLRTPELVIELGLQGSIALEGVKLNDISDAYVQDTYHLLEKILSELRAFDRESLTAEQQISYDVYEWYLQDELAGRDFLYYPYQISHFITSIHFQTMQFFTEIHPVTTQQDAEDYITRLRLVEPKLAQLVDNLKIRQEAGIIPPRMILQTTRGRMRNLTGDPAVRNPFYTALRDKVRLLDEVDEAGQDLLLEEARAVVADSVIPAYEALAEYLRDLEDVAPLDDGVWQFPEGEAYYNYTLRHHTSTNMTAAEIHALGLQELERIHAEMRVQFDALGYPADESLSVLFQRVARDGGTVSGSQAQETFESIIETANQNLGGAFDIFPEAEVVVISDPNGGGYYIPAALDGSRPGAFYAYTGPQAYYRMPSLAYHEAIPGHHLQVALAQEMDLPLFRNNVLFTAYVEGWGLYAEQLAWELGWYDGDPYGDLGRLQYQAFRAARLVVDTGIHAMGWTFDEAVEFWVENVGHEAGFAQNQIARYVAWPGQSTAYMVGMLKILELRQRAMDALGDNFDLAEFHGVILSQGSMPLDILERTVDDYLVDKAQN